jgi:hypothetical protein
VSTHGEWYKFSMEHTLANTATVDCHPNTVMVPVILSELLGSCLL